MKSSESVKKTKPGLLSKILFRLYKPQMLALAKMPHNELEPQCRYNDGRFDFVFHDSKGYAWYKMKDDCQFPIGRKLYSAEAFSKFINAINEADVRLSIEAIQLALFEKDPQTKKMSPNIARIGYICETLLARQGTIISRELLNELAACYFFREDEAIEFVNDQILKEKIQTVSVEGDLVKDLFYSKGLDELFPYLKDMDGMLDEVMRVFTQELTAQTKVLNSYVDGATGRNTSQVQS